jgi:hypothetical protein
MNDVVSAVLELSPNLGHGSEINPASTGKRLKLDPSICQDTLMRGAVFSHYT